MSGPSPRRIVKQPRFELELKRLLATVPRAADAWAAFERVVARAPESGMPVPGRSSFRSRPLHLETGSFLVLYTYDAAKVVCIALKPVPTSTFS